MERKKRTKNTIGDLNNLLFEQAERLLDDDLTDEQLEKELRRSDGIKVVADQIIRNEEIAYKTMVHLHEYGEMFKDGEASVPAMLEVRDD